MGILSEEGREEDEGLSVGERAGEVGMVRMYLSVRSVLVRVMCRCRRLVKRR